MLAVFAAMTSLVMAGCKPQPQAQNAALSLPGPITQFGQQMTPGFTEVGAYTNMVKTSAAAAFLNGGERPFTVPCDDPSVNIAMRPERNRVESCVIAVKSLDDLRLTARISNGWLIVSDAQGTRRVSEADFAAAQP